jgi:anthranilate phosphoribosyltransferase
LPRAAIEDIRCGRDSAESAAMMKNILSGETGARRDMVLLNSGAALMAAGAADDIGGGIELAAECIDSGAAREKLEALIAFSNQVGR